MKRINDKTRKDIRNPRYLDHNSGLCQKMQENGIFQWNEHYPSKEAFIKDIERDELFVIEENNIVQGTIVISTLMDDEYRPIQWLTPNGNSTYIHRLSVHPDLQGKGLAQQMMDFAENYSSENNFISVRLDTFSQNKRNQRFYEQRGYQKLGTSTFPNKATILFIVMN